MKQLNNKNKGQKMKGFFRREKVKNIGKGALMLSAAVGLGLVMHEVGYAAEGNAAAAVTLDFVDKLTATVKHYMAGAGSLVIDAILIAGGGWASAKASNPAPVILALVSVMCFEIFVKLLMT